MKKSNSNIQKGFTIVELAVVLVVIGVLAMMGTFAWSSWQRSSAIAAVKSDVKQAATAMENARNFSDSGYPTSLPTSYKPGPNVTVTYVSGNAAGFCIQGTSTKVSSVVFRVNSSVSKEPVAGACS